MIRFFYALINGMIAICTIKSPISVLQNFKFALEMVEKCPLRVRVHSVFTFAILL